jgi:hypothetical protein
MIDRLLLTLRLFAISRRVDILPERNFWVGWGEQTNGCLVTLSAGRVWMCFAFTAKARALSTRFQSDHCTVAHTKLAASYYIHKNYSIQPRGPPIQ